MTNVVGWCMNLFENCHDNFSIRSKWYPYKAIQRNFSSRSLERLDRPFGCNIIHTAKRITSATWLVFMSSLVGCLAAEYIIHQFRPAMILFVPPRYSRQFNNCAYDIPSCYSWYPTTVLNSHHCTLHSLHGMIIYLLFCAMSACVMMFQLLCAVVF